jgi:hypothetical protein
MTNCAHLTTHNGQSIWLCAECRETASPAADRIAALTAERDALAGRLAALAEYAEAKRAAAKTRWDTGRFEDMRASGHGAHNAYYDMARRLREGSETE